MKKLTSLGAASVALLAPVSAFAQTAPAKASDMIAGVDISDAKVGILAAAALMLGLMILTLTVKYIKGQFR